MQRASLIGLAALLLCLPSAQGAQVIGYSISDTTRNLYRINLETGEATNLGVIPFAVNDELEGLTAVGDRIFAASEANFGDGTFWDVTTPPGTLIGSTGDRFGTEAGLGYNPINQTFYNAQANDDPTVGAVGTQLYSIAANGAATAIGTLQSAIHGDRLGINAAGEAFASDFRLTDSLYRVDLGTGALSLVGGLGIGDVSLDSGLDFAPDGTLWALTENGNIYTVSTSTGAATFRASVTVGGVPFSQADGGELEGLAVTVVPEPSTVALLGAGLVSAGVGSLLRRRARSA